MTLTELKVVPYDEITKEDAKDIHKAITADPHGIDPREVYWSLRCYVSTLWRYTGSEGRGVFITKELRYGTDPELFVWYLGGKGLRQDGDYISKVFEEYCRLNGLSRISALVKPGVLRYLKKFGFEPDRYLVSKEVSNGRQSLDDNADPRHPGRV